MDVRLLIATWPADAPRGAVSRFCREHGLSRSRFYELRQRAVAEGLPAALADRPRAPQRNPRAVPVELEELAVRVRKQLADDGWDCGPLSVAHELRRLGLIPPSRATLARIFTRRGLVVPAPQKRPRSSWRRFTFPTPNGCWQLDATSWTLLEGAGVVDVVVFQVLDDHSRRILASLAAPSETSDAACQVVQTALARFGVPQLFLTDNGVALNTNRRGLTATLTALLQALGCKPISSRPYHPQTCGKNERVHATLKRYLRSRPRAASLPELQAQLDAFDEHYNEHRPHQALHGLTPVQAWAATPPASPPTPAPTPPSPDEPAGRLTATKPVVVRNGSCWIGRICIHLGWEHRGHTVIAVRDGDHIDVFDAHGTHLRGVDLQPGQRYYASGRPRGGNHAMRRSTGTTTNPPSAMS